jgi:hypothetical protein
MKNKLATLVAVIGVVAMSGLVYSAKTDGKNYELERAVRLQTLTNMALNNKNYELACKAQHEVTDSIVRAGVVDVIEQADVVESEICSLAWTTTISAIN